MYVCENIYEMSPVAQARNYKLETNRYGTKVFTFGDVTKGDAHSFRTNYNLGLFIEQTIRVYPAFKRMQIAPVIDTWGIENNGTNCVACYEPMHIKPTMYLSYKDFGSSETQMKWGVTSNRIRMGRFKNDQFRKHTKASNDLSKAIKLLKTWVRPPTVPETFDYLHNSFYKRATEARYEKQTALREAKQELANLALDNGDLLRELIALYDGNYHFTHASIPEKLKAIKEKTEQMSTTKQDLPDSCTAVLVLPDDNPDPMVLCVNDYPAGSYHVDFSDLRPQAMRLNDLPESVKTPMLMLQMAEPDELIHGVGYKKDEHTYFCFPDRMNELTDHD